MRNAHLRFGLFIVLALAPLVVAIAQTTQPRIVATSTSEDFVREHAAKILACPQDKISLKNLGTKKGKVKYEATGCGHSTHYITSGTGTNECHCTKHCPVGPGSPGGGTTCCEWSC